MFALWDILETKTGVSFARIRYKQVITALLCLWFAFFGLWTTLHLHPHLALTPHPYPSHCQLLSSKPPNPHHYPLYASSMSYSLGSTPETHNQTIYLLMPHIHIFPSPSMHQLAHYYLKNTMMIIYTPCHTYIS